LRQSNAKAAFSMNVWHFAVWCQRYQRRKFCFLLGFLSLSTNGESFSFYWHFCPSLPTVKVLFCWNSCQSLLTVKVVFFTGIFVQIYQWWKVWFLLAFLTKSTNV